MTTDRPRRAAHPALSARILSTGIAVSTTLGLTSAYAIGAASDDASSEAATDTSPTSGVAAAGNPSTTQLSALGPISPSMPTPTVAPTDAIGTVGPTSATAPLGEATIVTTAATGPAPATTLAPGTTQAPSTTQAPTTTAAPTTTQPPPTTSGSK